MEGDFRKVFSAPVNRLTAAIRLTWQILSAWVNRWTVAAIAITIVILAIVAKENFLYLLSICSMPFVVIIVSIMVSLAAKKHPRGTESKGQIFVYPHFIRKFFWVFFFIIVALLGFVLFDNYPKNEVRDLVTVLVVTGILFLGCVFLSWAAKVEYLEVSADGDTLTKSGVFSGKIVFGWNDVVGIKKSIDYYGSSVLLLKNGKKIKFQPMWSGHAEFYQLLSKKRPDLLSKFRQQLKNIPIHEYLNDFTAGNAVKNKCAITGLILGIIGIAIYSIRFINISVINIDLLSIICMQIVIIGLIFSIKGFGSLKRKVAIAGIVLNGVNFLIIALSH